MQIKKSTENEVVDSVGKSNKEYTKLLIGSCILAFVLEIKESRLQSVKYRTEGITVWALVSIREWGSKRKRLEPGRRVQFVQITAPLETPGTAKILS